VSQYPVIAAGERVNAALLRSMMGEFVLKPADTTKTNNTMADDPHLTTGDLVAGATYWVEFRLGCSGLLAADIKLAWTVPASSTGLRFVDGPGSSANDASADNIAMRAGGHGFATAIAYSGVRNGSNQFRVYEDGWITLAGTSGPVTLSWAQNTTDATASRVAAGSLLRWWRLA